jgi:enoyl-CoA hydratase/carnithine racemase
MALPEDPLVLVDYRTLDDAGGGATAALLTLNRPAELNAITWDMLRAIDSVLDEISTQDEVRTVLVTGAGRAFCAGGDLKSYVSLQRDPVNFPRFVAELHRIFGRFRELRVPVVALVNGVTAAGGLELVLNCDVVMMARSARIGDAHLNFGQMGGGGSLTLLPRAIGLQRASELIFSGRFLDAEQAVEWGLAVSAVADDELLGAGLAFAAGVAEKSPLAVANAKEILNAVALGGLDVASGLRLERERNAFYCLTSEDAPEGLQAFAEKRRPRFSGR